MILSRLDGEVEKRAAAEQAAANSSTLFHAAKLEFVALNAKIGKCAMRDVSRAEERSYVEELLALVNQALDIASPFRAERQQLFTSSRGGPPSAVVAAESDSTQLAVATATLTRNTRRTCPSQPSKSMSNEILLHLTHQVFSVQAPSPACKA